MFKKAETWHDRLDHMLQAIGEAEEIMEALSFEAFQDDTRSVRAMERLCEIISEASKHIPETVKARYPYPWRDIIGMRNIIAHDYGKVDFRLLWDTFYEDFPPLKALILKIKAEKGAKQ